MAGYPNGRLSHGRLGYPMVGYPMVDYPMADHSTGSIPLVDYPTGRLSHWRGTHWKTSHSRLSHGRLSHTYCPWVGCPKGLSCSRGGPSLAAGSFRTSREPGYLATNCLPTRLPHMPSHPCPNTLATWEIFGNLNAIYCLPFLHHPQNGTEVRKIGAQRLETLEEGG